MIISLVGMSGCGKTFWAKKLAAAGFKHYGCDDLIAKKLQVELAKPTNVAIRDVAQWMGQPYEPRYQKSSQLYLSLEKAVVTEILATIGKEFDAHQNVVIDTTGSIIYCGSDILKQLIQTTKIIYFHVPDEVKNEMYNRYLQDPKPVIWGNSFRKKTGENNVAALKRCYPSLLVYRTKRYKKLADITLDYFQVRQDNFDTTAFISLVEKNL